MNCPICGKEMEKGGIIAEKAITVMWHPEQEYQKKGLNSYCFRFGKLLGTHHPLRGVVKIPDAWYCGSCHKVTGIFEVTGKID